MPFRWTWRQAFLLVIFLFAAATGWRVSRSSRDRSPLQNRPQPKREWNPPNLPLQSAHSSASPSSPPSNPTTNPFAPATISNTNKDAYTGPVAALPTHSTLQRTTTYRLDDVGGWPVCRTTNVCIEPLPHAKNANLLSLPNRLLIPSEASETRLGTTMAARMCGPRRKHDASRPLLSVPSSSSSSSSPPPTLNVTWLLGTTLIVDTYIPNVHIDHVGSKVLQARALYDALAAADAPLPDRIVFLQQSRFPSAKRPPSLALTQLVLVALGPDLVQRNVSVFRSDLESFGKITCLESAMEISNVFERKFLDEAGAAAWRHRLYMNRHSLGIPDFPSESDCPKRQNDVLVLQRSEGQGLRSILNYDVLEEVLDEVGVCRESYRNVSFGGSTPLSQQARVFQDFGLIIASHSGQLFNVVFAGNLSAVLEIRADTGDDATHGADLMWNRLPTPFCVGGVGCSPAYNVTRRHADPSTFSVRHGYRNDIRLNKRVFKEDLEALLARQRARYATRPECTPPKYLSSDPTNRC